MSNPAFGPPIFVVSESLTVTAAAIVVVGAGYPQSHLLVRVRDETGAGVDLSPENLELRFIDGFDGSESPLPVTGVTVPEESQLYPGTYSVDIDTPQTNPNFFVQSVVVVTVSITTRPGFIAQGQAICSLATPRTV
jgi:hypothetical protein